ncbi:thioredoxin [Candidatus Woesearchaeota archaeon]|nr:thioredoxin [Candidatus Woesearchaeota archaeon]
MEAGKMETEIKVDDTNFETRVMERSKTVPVIVDFWAEWCMPCRVLGPTLEKLAKEYKGRFVLAKANVGSTKIKANEYSVMSIPNVKLFKNGKVADEFIGALPEAQVKEWLDKNI